jgi:multicomponent Na+:H+ antiporter subunit B
MARRERAGRAQEDDQSPQARKAEESEERGTEEAGEPTGRRQPAPDPDAGMGEVVKVATRVLLPILFAAGIMIYAWGYSPGGGFPAGTVVAGIALLVYAANGVGSLGRLGSTSHLEAIEVVASLGILALALSGLVLAGSVTANVLPLGRVGTVTGGGNLQLLSGIELLEVATGVLVTILALLGMHHDWSDDR